MIDIIIWSKNRAAQLDLLLRSIRDHFPDAGTVFVLYHATTEAFNYGYNKLKMKAFPFQTKYIQQENYDSDIKMILDKMLTPYILGISDDCVFIKPVNMPADFKLENDEIAFSLRLGNNHNYCLTADLPMDIPIFTRPSPDTIRWEWAMQKANIDWGYPLPVDSHIYDRKFITALLKGGGYSNPCDMENFLNQKCRDYTKPFMRSFTECKLLSIPANRTNDSSNNLFNGMSAEDLNAKWLEGFEISTENIYNISTNACHKFVPYMMRRI